MEVRFSLCNFTMENKIIFPLDSIVLHVGILFLRVLQLGILLWDPFTAQNEKTLICNSIQIMIRISWDYINWAFLHYDLFIDLEERA